MKYSVHLTIGVLLAVQLAYSAEPPQTMTLDQAFAQLKTYDYGQSDKALRVIELGVVRYATSAARRAEVAGRLAAVLAEPGATEAAKVFVCQQLLAVGTEAQAPALAKLLDDPKLAEIARFTLQAIPGEASLSAVRDALGRLQGMPLVGAINTLGMRRDAASVGALAKLLASADPLVASSCAESLGKIGSPEAAVALVKAQVPAKAVVSLHNAQLQCAEHLAVAGDPAGATAIYQHVWSSHRPARWRAAGLVGLARVDQQKAASLVLKTLASEDPLLRATAVRLSGRLPGRELTDALVQRLDQLDGPGRVLLLGVLAERGDRSAADAAAKQLDAKEETVRAAAVEALASLGDASYAPRLALLAAGPAGPVQQAARLALARLSASDVDPKLAAMAAEGEPAVRTETIRALAARRSTASTPVLLKAAADADGSIRVAAIDALGAVAGADSYAKLVGLLVTAATPADADAAQRAVLTAGARLPEPSERLAPVLAALAGASAPAQCSLVRVLAGFGGPEALEAVRPRLAHAEASIRDAAVRSLANWLDVSAAGDLLKVAQASEVPTHRLLAVRGYLRLAGEIKDDSARLKMLDQVRPIATTTAAKRMLLGCLADAADPGALHVATTFVEDADVEAEAAAAMLRIARGLVRSHAPAVRSAMIKLMDTVKDKSLSEQAAALDEEAAKAPSPADAAQALQYDKKRSDAQKALLAKRAPKGYRLACYLDCGPDAADGVKGGAHLRQVAGGPYYWPDSGDLADVRFGSVAFDSQRVVFEASGLSPKRTYQIGFSWWDFDHDTRAQSVWLATGKGRNETRALDKTKLPSGAAKQGPDVKTVPVPRELVADGSLRISFRNEAAPNVVVSEVWLWESEAEGQ